MSTSNQPVEKMQLNMALPGRLGLGIKRLIEAGEFATQAEYIRHLIQNDLPNRLAQIEQDEIIRTRLARVEQGAPLIPHEEAVRYLEALMRGEKPDRPNPAAAQPMEIHWFPNALADIDAIFDHINADSPAAAREIISELRSTIDLLRENPKLGRSGRWPRTRELVVPPYVVAYREADAAITILAIYHSARMWPDSWLRAHIEEGLKQAKNGQFASEEEVQRAFDSFGGEEPPEEQGRA